MFLARVGQSGALVTLPEPADVLGYLRDRERLGWGTGLIIDMMDGSRCLGQRVLAWLNTAYTPTDLRYGVYEARVRAPGAVTSYTVPADGEVGKLIEHLLFLRKGNHPFRDEWSVEELLPLVVAFVEALGPGYVSDLALDLPAGAPLSEREKETTPWTSLSGST